MPRPKVTYAQPYADQAWKDRGHWVLFFVPDRPSADKIARWLRREGLLARFLELDDRYLLAVKAPT